MYTLEEKFSGPANAEGVTGHGWKALGSPYGVASGDELLAGQGRPTRQRAISEERSVRGNVGVYKSMLSQRGQGTCAVWTSGDGYGGASFPGRFGPRDAKRSCARRVGQDEDSKRKS